MSNTSVMPANSAANYTGHGTKTGGLQQHSLGGLYPYAVIAKGDCSRGLAALDWVATDLRTGNESRPHRSYKEAELTAWSLRLRNLMHS